MMIDLQELRRLVEKAKIPENQYAMPKDVYEMYGNIPEILTELLDRLQAAERNLQYEQHRTGRQGTHAEGCYKWGPEHWECAMREIERMAPVLNAAREYDAICVQIHAMTEPIPGYMLDVARRARLSLSEALMRMDAASSSAQRAPAGEQGAPFDEYCPNPDVKP